MIRSWLGQGGQVGEWKSVVEIIVREHTIKFSKNRVSL